MKNLRHIVIKKSNFTDLYVCAQPMQSDFHALYLVFDQEKVAANHWSNFIKNASLTCWTTSKVFINKNGRNIELFDVQDLINNEDLALPKTPKFTLTAKNFVQFMGQIQKLQQYNSAQIYLAIDSEGCAHATTDLASIKAQTFFGSLTSKFKTLLRIN